MKAPAGPISIWKGNVPYSAPNLSIHENKGNMKSSGTIYDLLHAMSLQLCVPFSLAGEYKASKKDIVRMLEDKQCDTNDRERWHRTGT